MFKNVSLSKQKLQTTKQETHRNWWAKLVRENTSLALDSLNSLNINIQSLTNKSKETKYKPTNRQATDAVLLKHLMIAAAQLLHVSRNTVIKQCSGIRHIWFHMYNAC